MGVPSTESMKRVTSLVRISHLARASSSRSAVRRRTTSEEAMARWGGNRLARVPATWRERSSFRGEKATKIRCSVRTRRARAATAQGYGN